MLNISFLILTYFLMAPILAQKGCPPTASEIQNECFFPTEFETTYKEGGVICNEMGGTFPNFDFNRSQGFTQSSPFWIGKVEFQENGVPACAVSGASTNKSLTPCTERRSVICQVPHENLCPLGWKYSPRKDNNSLSNGACYKYTKQAVSQQNAQTFCDLENSNLVSIHNKDDNEFVGGLVTEGESAWIGLNMVVDEKGTEKRYNFSWIDRTPVDYKIWEDYGKTRKLAADEKFKHCFSMKPIQNHFGWNEEKCDDKLDGFICKRPPIPSTVLTLYNFYKNSHGGIGPVKSTDVPQVFNTATIPPQTSQVFNTTRTPLGARSTRSPWVFERSTNASQAFGRTSPPSKASTRR